MKIGITYALDAPEGSPFPIVDPDPYTTVGKLSEMGFDSVEFHIRTPDLLDGPRIKDLCLSQNMEISTIGTGMAYSQEGLSITDANKDIRNKAVKRLKDQMDLASVLDCFVIIGSMRGKIEKGDTLKNVNNRMLESMSELIEHAEKKNVDVVVEAIDFYETNYLETADDVLELIEELGSNRVLVHLDSFHMNISEKSLKDPILKCGSRLGHMHLADNNRNYPGWGHLNFPQIIKTLKEIDYKNSLTLECYPDPDGYTAAKRGLDYIRSIL